MPLEDVSKNAISEKPEARKIGGWLILVVLGVFITPLRLGFILWTVHAPIFSDGTWEVLTVPGSTVYSPFWAPLLLGEMFVNAALLLVFLYMLFLVFQKKSSFPKWYAGAAIFSAVFIFLDAYFVSWMFPGTPIFDPETSKEFARSLVSCLIWVPYLFISERSKETFVN